MKIVVSGYVGKKITGIGRNLVCLLEHATSDNEYVIYTNFDMKDKMAFQNPHVQVKTYPVSKSSSIGNLLWTTVLFPFYVIKEKADCALIPNFTLLLLKFRPTVIIMHDLIEFNIPHKFSRLKMFYRTKIADPITAKMADRIITVSNHSKGDIIKFLGIAPNKITVVYNGVDRKKFHRMDEGKSAEIFRQRNWPLDFLLYAGTLDHPGKNAMTLVKAYERLRNEGRYEGSLILAGMPGAGFDVLAAHIHESKYRRDIILTGFVTDEELVALYSRCRVFCFLSLYEGFGIPPLEALACGAKVIVSNTSSLPEVVGEFGVKVGPCAIPDIANVIEDGLVERVKKTCQNELEEHLSLFNWENLSKNFEGVFLLI